MGMISKKYGTDLWDPKKKNVIFKYCGRQLFETRYIKITQQLWVELDQIHFSTEICWLIKVSKFVHILRSLHLHTHIIMLPQNASFHQLRNVSIVSFFRKNDLFFLFLLMILWPQLFADSVTNLFKLLYFTGKRCNKIMVKKPWKSW